MNTNTNKNKNKWTLDEEKHLVFKLRDGVQMKDIGELTGRSYGAIKERLKKIIYENINDLNNNDEIRKIAKYLNLDEELVKKYYEAYRERNGVNGVNGLNGVNGVDRKDETNISKVNKEVRQIDDKDKTNKSQVNKEVNEEVKQTGGAYMTIRKQNELLEDILKNHELKKKVGKLVRTKQIDRDSKEVLKKILLESIKQ